MKKKFDFVIIGATGTQGRITTIDLLKNNYSILLCGRDKSRVKEILKRYKKTKFEYLDLRDKENTVSVIKRSGSNIVINCAEGNWNANTVKACIKANANYIDLGSEILETKKQFKLHNILRKKNLISITGCGSTAGINNVMLRYATEKMDRVHDIDLGFAWNSNMKVFVVPFSMESVTEEFIGKAILLQNGRYIKKNPQDFFEYPHYRTIGRQRSFLIGHHPEPYTFYVYLKDKGIKNIRFFASFPEHSYQKIMEFINLGLGSKEEIIVDGKKIRKVDFLVQLLKNLEIPKGYKEKENLWVKIKGRKNGKKKEVTMECIVLPLRGWEWATCNIDTGMIASIIAQMIKDEVIKDRGSFSPEFVVPPRYFFKELAKRKMYVYENGKRIN